MKMRNEIVGVTLSNTKDNRSLSRKSQTLLVIFKESSLFYCLSKITSAKFSHNSIMYLISQFF